MNSGSQYFQYIPGILIAVGCGVFELASPTGKSFRFVRASRDATRDHYSVGPGAVKCGSFASLRRPVWRSGLAWLGLLFFFSFSSFCFVRLCVCALLPWLRFCVVALLAWLRCSCSPRACPWLGLASVLLLPRACALALGFCLLSFGFCSFGFSLNPSLNLSLNLSLNHSLNLSLSLSFNLSLNLSLNLLLDLSLNLSLSLR